MPGHGAGHGPDHGFMGHRGTGGMHLHDVEYDAFLANDRTLSDPQVFRVERGGRVRLRLINGERLAGALRDMVLVPAGGRVTIAFDAGNPGNWALHCHHLYHMAGGMMTPEMMQMMGGRPGMGTGMGMHGMMSSDAMLYGMPHGAVAETTPECVRALLEHRLEWHGNPRLKLGEVSTASSTNSLPGRFP